ncbi:serine--tRNA ligase [Hugenholtzia roseola]|uniref:serine--tRNA ligase n=1 Tax=Hugenholtzia roseola TaxID=1002 RepID=UPI0003F753A5|nr:serine--tRNA ligase [Hugenholtzia roseola]
MLQIAYIQNQTQAVIDALKKRNLFDIEEKIKTLLDLDDERKKIQFQLNNLQAQANEMAKSIGSLMKAGKKEEAEHARAQAAQAKIDIKNLEELFKEKSDTLKELLYQIPNTPHLSVKAGKSADDNEIVDTWGVAKKMEGEALPHWDLIKQYDIIDFDLGVKITGAGFPVYKGKGARLQRAMINYFLDQALAAGFYEIQPPIFVNAASGYGTGQLPDKEGQMYYMPADDLYAIPTAEVPITNLFRDQIVKEEELPIRLVGYTPCFRREAGSWGAHVRGLNRLHQFDKVEIVAIEHPEKSYAQLELMLKHVQGLLQALELPYRTLRLCGGDMGFTSALTYDLEVYSAAQDRWLEVSSVSNFETYQANRLLLRYQDKDGKKALAHTLNGSALALPRILAALLENNQTPEGIKIPKILQPYCGFEMI